MRLRKFRLRSMGPFEDVTVDLDSLPGPLVALVGPNGEGKSSALELAYAGAQYRDTPTQGTLAERSTDKGSLVESWIGDLYIKHRVADGKVLVQRGDNPKPLVPSAGLTDFDRWAEKNLSPKDLFHAGVFGAQGSSGFLGMTPGPRKGVVLRALGIERVERMSKLASEKRDDEQEEAGRLARQIADERARIGADADVGAALALRQQAVADALAALAAAQDSAGAAQAALGEARRLASERTLALAAAQAHEERAEEMRQRALALAESGEEASRRRDGLVEIVAGADEHRRSAAGLEEWRERLADQELAARVTAERAVRRAELESQRGAAEEALRALEQRHRGAEQALEQLDAVRALAARVEGLRTGRSDVETRGREATAAAEQAERDRAAAGREKDAAGRVSLEQRARAQRAAELLRNLPLVEEAERSLPELRADAAAADEARAAAAEEVVRIRALLVDGKDQRIAGLRDGLVSSFEVDSVEAVHGVARGALDEDDALAAEHAAAPAALQAAEQVAMEKTRLWRASDQKVGEAERRAERRAEMDRAVAERDGALANAEAADAEALKQEWIAEQAIEARDALRHEVAILRRGYVLRARKLAAAEQAAARLPELAGAEATMAALKEPIAAARTTIATIERELHGLDAAPSLGASPTSLAEAREAVQRAQASAERLVEIAQAEATLLALDEHLARDAAARAQAEAKLAALGAAPVVPEAVDLGRAEREVDYQGARAREATRAHATAEAALTAARDAAARIADLEVQLHAAEEVVSDWTKIAKTLGRDGLQALLIDAAGPELTALVNDLLRSCFGSRYTVDIKTVRAKKDGKGEKEVCDVLVFDARRPDRGWRDGKLYSGGQKTILGEACALALTALSCRRAGLTDVTLVRDETAGALDRENAAAYITMLRRAAQIIGASKVVFVSHDEETWALADSVLLVRDGRIVQARVVDGRVEPFSPTEVEEVVFEEREAA